MMTKKQLDTHRQVIYSEVMNTYIERVTKQKCDPDFLGRTLNRVQYRYHKLKGKNGV